MRKKTIAQWLEEQGFERSRNGPEVLYLLEKDLLLLLYPDHLLAKGIRSDVEWIFDLLTQHFDCTEIYKPGRSFKRFFKYQEQELAAMKSDHQSCPT